MFGGAGHARLAIDDLLTRADPPASVAAAFFTEQDAGLARAVQGCWRRRAIETRVAPFECLGNDEWDLARPHTGALDRLLCGTPDGALLLIFADAPARQLDPGSAHQGCQGLCGDDSVRTLAVAAVAGVCQRTRPDIVVHAMVVMPANALEVHLRAAAGAMGIGPPRYRAHAEVIDAGAWSAIPRKRIVLATLPSTDGGIVPPLRPSPWEAGWRAHPKGTMLAHRPDAGPPGAPPGLRARQFRPAHLLYEDAQSLHAVPLKEVGARLARALPAEYVGGWHALEHGFIGPETGGRDDGAVSRTARYMAREGRRLGARAPTAEERGRAMGNGAYLASLGLDDRALYDAQGSYMDRGVPPVRNGAHKAARLSGQPMPRHSFPGVADVEAAYQALRTTVAAQGLSLIHI